MLRAHLQVKTRGFHLREKGNTDLRNAIGLGSQSAGYELPEAIVNLLDSFLPDVSIIEILEQILIVFGD